MSPPINASSQISSGDDENTDYVHTVILTIKAIVLGLLQITQPKAEIRDPTLLCFLPFSLIYFVLFLNEFKLRRNQSLIHRFLGHTSHLFGTIAACILVSLISPVFAFVVGMMCVFWFLFATYSSYTSPPQDRETIKTANQSDQIPPV